MGEATVLLKDRKVRRFLKGLQGRIDSITERDQKVIGLLSSVIFKDIVDHFEKEEGPDGAWKEWSESYEDFMFRIGKGSNKILQDTGRLRQSFKPTSVRDTSEGLLWFNNAKTKKGFPYAAAHNAGGPQLPQRKFMWISNRAMLKIEGKILEFIERS